ncbi:MAG: outer membrane beta-barrel protein, partial [Bdellovibrio sp.]
MKQWILALPILLFCQISNGIATEMGLNYQYKKTSVDSLNNIEQQGITGTLSLYFWEQIATEISYTNSLYVKREKADTLASSSIQRVTTQFADVYGLDIIYVFSGRKARLQPYVKGGLAYLKKKQTYIQQADTWDSGWIVGWGPSYGAGLKFFLTEALSLRLGW